MPKNNPIDTTQNKFLKQMLGVQVQTPAFYLKQGECPYLHFPQNTVLKIDFQITCSYHLLAQRGKK